MIDLFTIWCSLRGMLAENLRGEVMLHGLRFERATKISVNIVFIFDVINGFAVDEEIIREGQDHIIGR